MPNWHHLLKDGEYARPEQILAGLTPEQATSRPSPGAHTIHEELWHAARWQSIIVNRDEALYEQWQAGRVYPEAGPADAAEWEALVAEFHAGLEKALWWAESPERLAHKTDRGTTMADVLVSLSVHNAYHLGKIVALRQALGAWGRGKG